MGVFIHGLLLSCISLWPHTAQANRNEGFRNKTIDYVIVGAGPAGFVLAEQLSQNPEVNVLLLEAGPTGANSSTVDIPAYAPFNDPGPLVWNFTSQPDPSLGGRAPALGQGHGLGGGTAVNYMEYCRGAPSVFNQWASILGDKGLEWESLLNDFKATSHFTRAPMDYSAVTNFSVYGNGSLEVTVPNAVSGFDPNYIEGLKTTLNLPEVDLNDGSGIGATYSHNTIRASNWTRDYALQAYGWQMAGRSNVRILDNAWVSHIGFEGKRAINVTYWLAPNNASHTVVASEIVVSAGSINSPKLLMLSGIGPKDHLNEIGIPVIHDVKAIGSNLYDHHFSVIELEVTSAIDTVWQWTYNTTVAKAAQREYGKNGSGPLSRPDDGSFAIYRAPDSIFEAVNDTFHQSLPPDRGQLLLAYGTSPFLPGGANVSIVSPFVALVQPQASGYIRLSSRNFRDDPLIFSNYYGSAGDKAAILHGYKKLREVSRSELLAPLVVREIFPGPNATTDGQLWQAIQESAQTFHHTLGTVAMGTVVDKDWRIKGLDGIRVVDSSTFPYPPTCHLQASVYAVAHRAARTIKENDNLPKTK